MSYRPVLGAPCPCCLRIVDESVFEAKKLKMQKNAETSRAKAKAAGKTVGRKRIRNDTKIRLCASKGMTRAEIALLFDVSDVTVGKAFLPKGRPPKKVVTEDEK
jgi:hypothetical protein